MAKKSTLKQAPPKGAKPAPKKQPKTAIKRPAQPIHKNKQAPPLWL